jgi:subtilisin family serine protease
MAVVFTNAAEVNGAYVEDAVDDGIIFVGAAMNDSTKIDVQGGIDYDNYLVATFTYYYHRGSWNTAAARSGVGGQRLSVCVGAASALVNESKATFSNCGPRIDIYAPGVNIISPLHTSGGSATLVNDSRNSSYKLGKYQGTSMASPQVCGILACALEQYPNMNQADIHEYLNQHSTKNQMTTTSGGYTDTTDLQGSENQYVFYEKERFETGVSGPKSTYGPRRSSQNGVKYPRTHMRITKAQ